MKIYFVRHGITQANIEKRYNGIVDEELSQLGIDNLNKVKALYRDLSVDYVYCSPLKRCQESFKILFDKYDIDEIRDDLIEMNLGLWAGQKYEDVIKDLTKQGYQMGDYVDPPNGETYDELFKRVKTFFNEIVDKHQEDQTIVVLTHGLVIGAVTTCLMYPDDYLYNHTPDNGLGCVFHMNNKDIVEYEVIKMV